MTDALYAFGLLKPSRLDDAAVANAPWLGAATLGVEVTEAELAECCGLGNIDPQHGFGAGAGAAVIEAALEWPVPPPGSKLVTIRPDPDAFGAMAILHLRGKGSLIGRESRDRVALVTRCDAFDHGDWGRWVEARGPLVHPARAAEVAFHPAEYRALGAVAGCGRSSVAARVAAMEGWLLTGALDPTAFADARLQSECLARAWNSGDLRVKPGADPRIAIVSGQVMGGLQLGYRLAPVVIAQTVGDPFGKVTIAQFARGHLDMAGLTDVLNSLEQGWGGSDMIIGSPQGVGTRLTANEIESAAVAALLPANLRSTPA